MDGERVLKELIYDCQRSLEGIEYANLDFESRGYGVGGTPERSLSFTPFAQRQVISSQHLHHIGTS
jgi:hypothetical protein